MSPRGHTARGRSHSIYEAEAEAKARCNEAKAEAVIVGLDALTSLLRGSPRNRRHRPPPVDEAASRSQVDRPPARRRLRFVLLLRPLTRRLNAFCLIASSYIFWQSF